jgi:hypothetical protein
VGGSPPVMPTGRSPARLAECPTSRDRFGGEGSSPTGHLATLSRAGSDHPFFTPPARAALARPLAEAQLSSGLWRPRTIVDCGASTEMVSCWSPRNKPLLAASSLSQVLLRAETGFSREVWLLAFRDHQFSNLTFAWKLRPW